LLAVRAAVLTASVILLIMDLDRPRRGLVKVTQQSMLEGPLSPGFPFNQVGNSFLLMEEQRDGVKFWAFIKCKYSAKNDAHFFMA
jgi:hypothetical protein